MDMVEVEITALVITQRYGTLSHGDILRTDAAFAGHLVDDAGAAKYTKPKAAKAAAPGPAPAPKPNKSKK